MTVSFSRSIKKIAACACALLVVAGAVPAVMGGADLFGTSIVADAGDYAHFRPSVSGVTLYDDQSVQSITVNWQWPYGSGCNGVVMTSKPIYREGEYSNYYGAANSPSLDASEKNIDWETKGNKDETKSNIIRDMEPIEVYGTGASPYYGSHKFEFKQGELPIEKAQTVYFYLWTRFGSKYYPDFQLAILDIKDNKVYLGQEEMRDGDGVVMSPVKFTTGFKAEEGLTYNGKEQVLVNASPKTAEGVTPSYAVTDTTVETLPADAVWSGSAKAKDAGKYRVWYKTDAAEDANYDPVLAGNYIDVTVSLAQLEVSAEGKAVVYDGEPHSITVNTNDDDAVIYYSSEEMTAENYKEIGTTEKPEYTDAGTYEVYYYVEPCKNYAGENVSGKETVTIEKADPDHSVVINEEQTYTGEALPLVVTATTEGGKLLYALGDENGALEPYTELFPAAVEVGEYYVWYKVEGDNNFKDVDPVCKAAKIVEPEVSTPDSSTPDSSEPDSSTPDSSEPDSSTPDSSTPDSSEPESSTPESKAPEKNGNPATGAAAAGVGALAVAAAAVFVTKSRKEK